MDDAFHGNPLGVDSVENTVITKDYLTPQAFNVCRLRNNLIAVRKIGQRARQAVEATNPLCGGFLFVACYCVVNLLNVFLSLRGDCHAESGWRGRTRS